LHENRCVSECSCNAAPVETLNWQKLQRYSFDVQTVPSAWIVRLLNTKPYVVRTSTCDCPADTSAKVPDEDEGTETTRTPSRAGVTVNESDESRDIDMLLRRFADETAESLLDVMLFLILGGSNSDCIDPAPPVAPLPVVEDDLLTAWTSRIVFWPAMLLPTARLDRTRLPLLANGDVTCLLLLLLALLLDNGRLADDDKDDNVDAETTVQQY